MRTKDRPTERLFTTNFLLLWAANFTVFASFHLLLPTLPLYVLSLGGTESQVGLIIGVLTISSVLARPWVGREADRRGKKVVLFWGALAFLLSMLSYNLAYTVGLLLLLRFFHGAAWAATNTPTTALVADIAPASRRGEAMGYYGTASNVAMAVGPILGVFLVGAYGFNQLFLAASGLALVTLAIISRIREPRPGTQGGDQPIGLAAPVETPRRGVSTWAALVYRPALFPALTVFPMTITYGGLVSFLPLLASRHNVNSGIFFTVYAVFLILARPLGGKVADVAGRPAAVIPGMASLALGLGLLAFSRDLPHFLAAAALYGIGFSFVTPALMALTVDRAAPQARGAAMGTFSAAFDLGIGLGAMLFGLLLEKTSFEAMYLAAAGIAIASLVTYAIGSRKTFRA